MGNSPIDNELDEVHAEARADWLAERPPREKPDPDETAGLDDCRRDRTAASGADS